MDLVLSFYTMTWYVYCGLIPVVCFCGLSIMWVSYSFSAELFDIVMWATYSTAWLWLFSAYISQPHVADVFLHVWKFQIVTGTGEVLPKFFGRYFPAAWQKPFTKHQVSKYCFKYSWKFLLSAFFKIILKKILQIYSFFLRNEVFSKSLWIIFENSIIHQMGEGIP